MIFTHPEVGSVGLTEQKAKEKHDVAIGKFREATDGMLTAGAADDIVSFLLEGAPTLSVSDFFSKLRAARPLKVSESLTISTANRTVPGGQEDLHARNQRRTLPCIR